MYPKDITQVEVLCHYCNNTNKQIVSSRSSTIDACPTCGEKSDFSVSTPTDVYGYDSQDARPDAYLKPKKH